MRSKDIKKRVEIDSLSYFISSKISFSVYCPCFKNHLYRFISHIFSLFCNKGLTTAWRDAVGGVYLLGLLRRELIAVSVMITSSAKRLFSLSPISLWTSGLSGSESKNQVMSFPNWPSGSSVPLSHDTYFINFTSLFGLHILEDWPTILRITPWSKDQGNRLNFWHRNT